jgi:hypothetical protein
VVSFHQVFPPKPGKASLLHHTRYMPRPSHSSRYYHPNNVGWEVQSGTSLTVQNLYKQTEIVEARTFVIYECINSKYQISMVN